MSFRRRLTLLTAGAAALAVAVVAAASYYLVRAELNDQIDDSLRERALGARAFLGPEGRFGRGLETGAPGGRPGPGRLPDGTGPGAPGNGAGLPEETFAQGVGREEPIAQLVDERGTVLISVGLDGDQLPVEPAVEALREGGPGTEVFTNATVASEPYRVLTLVGPAGAAVQIARSRAEVDSTLDRLAVIMLIVAGAGVSLAAALGFAVARAAMVPAVRLTEAAEEVAETEDLSRRIEVTGDDELARLGVSFNAMLAALEISVGAQKQLVADASHELRTPLTSLRTNIETLARRPQMPEADRRRLMADLETELAELGRLVDDIVDLAREGAEERATSEAVEARLDEIVAAAVDRARRRAGDVTIEAELAPTIITGAPERLDRAIGNLLDNAVKWTPAGGTISVGLREGTVTVTDDGPGIAEADLPHIFDRFYRSAAARGTPGSGLGLAIVRQVAEAHGGSVVVANRAEGGAAFVLSLPDALAHPAPAE